MLSEVTFVKNNDVCFGAKVCGPPVGTSSFLAVVSDQQSHLVSICESRGLFQNQSSDAKLQEARVSIVFILKWSHRPSQL